MINVLLVGAGGSLGSMLRYTLSLYLPYPTVIVNLVGSFFIGILLAFGQSRLGSTWYHLLIPGFLGGFTTYSAFSGEILGHLKEQLYTSAFLYIATTLVIGLLLTAAGFFTTRLLLN
ncbi:MAG: CrcB family protein [Bacteriovoracaceae bacterium]|nr:CrcB family protein [Bacteriovoracaceae bacterium]